MPDSSLRSFITPRSGRESYVMRSPDARDAAPDPGPLPTSSVVEHYLARERPEARSRGRAEFSCSCDVIHALLLTRIFKG
ncbi:hypothetical protein EVAR_103219_1 [Eumeta japonica]|uniref:Uncharacterized protein n=1 Tax=Eumeta variegata TaxID=151549 RepID=A0A4C1X7X1_EUMVA|nr:hypothetical protein EVAR_103219_1 [Eumeta japonica]